jgi:6,7-dimethyl-8-ribityllumazine synthase
VESVVYDITLPFFSFLAATLPLVSGPPMAQVSYQPLNVPRVEGGRAVIIMSKWYSEYSDAMVRKCCDTLLNAGFEQPQVHVVPGCLEIPLAARRLVQRDPSVEAVIVFGVILKGDTYHFEIVKDLCMSGLERVMFECDVPIINEILPVDTIEYVVARCGDNEKNKGFEAGIATAEIVDWRRRHPKL